MDAAIRRILTQELEAAAKTIAAKYGLEVAVGGGTYSPTMLRKPVEFTTSAAKSRQVEVASSILGLSPGIIGKTFRHKTKTFTVVALDPSKPKYCVSLKDQNGKGFKCSVQQLKDLGGIS